MQLIFIAVIFFFYKCGESMLDITVRPYLLHVVYQKQFSGNGTSCDSSHNDLKETDNVQKAASVYFFLYRLAAHIPAVFTGLYLGAWSDKHGRRLPMVFSCIGTILSVLVYVSSMCFKVNSLTVWVILTGTLFQGLSGKGAVLSMIVNCFISEISEDKNVTKHTGMLFSMNFFGQCLGAFLAGIFVWNLLISFATVIGLNVSCILIIFVFVKEIKGKDKGDIKEFPGKKECCSADIKRTKSYTVGDYCSMDQNLSNSKKQLQSHAKGNEHFSVPGDIEKQNSLSCCLFDEGFKSYLTVVMKKRTKRNKLHIIILLLVAFVSACDCSGVIDVLLLFVDRGPFNWTSSLYSFFVASENISIGVALMVILPVLSKCFKLSDFKLIIVGLLCKVIRYNLIAISTQTWIIFALNFVWSGASFVICLRSVLSTCIEEDELGKIFSLYSVIEIAAKLIGSVAYLSIYMATVSLAPSVTFFIMGFINFIILITLAVTQKIIAKTEKNDVDPIFIKGPYAGIVTSTR